MQSGTDEPSFICKLGIAISGRGIEIERSSCQGIRDEDTQLLFRIVFSYRTTMDM